jgi:hypothetical protein
MMHHFYQPLRHLLLANELCWLGGWLLEPHLLVIANPLSINRDGKPHAAEFHEFQTFQSALRVPSERAHLPTRRELLVGPGRRSTPACGPCWTTLTGWSISRQWTIRQELR